MPNPAAVFALPGNLFTTVASRKAYPPKPPKPKAPVILQGKQSSYSFSVFSIFSFERLDCIFYSKSSFSKCIR